MSARTYLPRILEDREEAGRRLADRLTRFRDEHPVILALPRGGVPVALEIARELAAPLDVLIVRKIGAPDNPEYGLGAIAEGGIQFLDGIRIAEAGYSKEDLDVTIARETEELSRRARAYRGDRPPLDVSGRTVILVDDGVATGGTVEAAIRAVRARHPRRVIVALGVSPSDTLVRLREHADEVIVLMVPEYFAAVGEWYRNFDQVSDETVRRLLQVDTTGPASAGPATGHVTRPRRLPSHVGD